MQRALIRQAEATIEATKADVTRYQLEANRQRQLLQTRIAGTEQVVEQAEANQKRAEAQLQLNDAQLDQQKATLASLDVQGEQLAAQVKAAEAQVQLARNNLGYTRIVAPADGLVGQRQVRPGQFVNVGRADHRCGVAAQRLGAGELQGNADDQRAPRRCRAA